VPLISPRLDIYQVPLVLGKTCPFCGEPWSSKSTCPPGRNRLGSEKKVSRDAVCPTCSKQFFAGRQQLYCSKKCGNVANNIKRSVRKSRQE
jgi:predicted nucleic acid-binding Zn ribbon protein